MQPTDAVCVCNLHLFWTARFSAREDEGAASGVNQRVICLGFVAFRQCVNDLPVWWRTKRSFFKSQLRVQKGNALITDYTLFSSRGTVKLFAFQFWFVCVQLSYIILVNTGSEGFDGRTGREIGTGFHFSRTKKCDIDRNPFSSLTEFYQWTKYANLAQMNFVW